jgi:hypothetical protein
MKLTLRGNKRKRRKKKFGMKLIIMMCLEFPIAISTLEGLG